VQLDKAWLQPSLPPGGGGSGRGGKYHIQKSWRLHPPLTASPRRRVQSLNRSGIMERELTSTLISKAGLFELALTNQAGFSVP
jgi:hypothetical protein